MAKYCWSGYSNYFRQKGLSVVELFVSMLIGLIVIAGSVQVILSSKRSYLDQDEVTFIQNNARFAVDLLAKDIRMAGYWGCGTKNTSYIAFTATPDAAGYISLNGIKGFEGETSSAAFPDNFKADVIEGTDAILIRRADSRELEVASHNAVTNEITLWETHSYEKGSTLVIADASCRNVGLFKMTGPSASTTKLIQHAMGDKSLNCTGIIKGDFSCVAACTETVCEGFSVATGQYPPGSKIMSFIAHAYYIAESKVMPGMPALYRQILDAGTQTTTSEEIALGVEHMDIIYGLDSDQDGSVDQFRKASEITTESDWEKVLSVQISLVFRSQAPVLGTAESRTLAGKTFNDRYMRQEVKTTVRVRNRG